MRSAVLVLTTLAGAALLPAQQTYLSIQLPERTRLLQDQRVDLVIEVRNPQDLSGFRVTANGRDITTRFRGPLNVDLDCDSARDAVYRADLQSFTDLGNTRIEATVTSAGSRLVALKDVQIIPFAPALARRNVILYIGDAMGQTYRDAARLVGRSGDTVPGVPGLREGFFDDLLEMDKMPVTGMAMTYSSDTVVPDSANTASTWSTGNKTYNNALGVFADGTDCAWRTGGVSAATLSSLTDNPRIETLWEYLKRKYDYRTGVVTTSDVTDATPAGEGAHVAQRATRSEITKNYIENPFTGGPVYDVILGGGMEQFESANRADRRNLIAEFQSKGYRYVTSAAELRSVTASAGALLGLFRRGTDARLSSSGVAATPDGNMNVAYDKLGLQRPGSEPDPEWGGFTDQPFLDLMTEKAIAVLSGPRGDQPFILMVEGASIDKQSHPNHAAGTVWDTIEFDKAVGVGRRFAAARSKADTLIVVSADHDQSLHILDVASVTDAELYDRGSTSYTLNPGVGAQTMKVFPDAMVNVRAAYGFVNGSDSANSTGAGGPPTARRPSRGGFPNYLDLNGDGYPDNREQGNRGRNRVLLGFRTGDHTGSSVPVSAEGPGAFLFTGQMDQSDIFFKIAASLTGGTDEGDKLLQILSAHPTNPRTYGK